MPELTKFLCRGRCWRGFPNSLTSTASGRNGFGAVDGWLGQFASMNQGVCRGPSGKCALLGRVEDEGPCPSLRLDHLQRFTHRVQIVLSGADWHEDQIRGRDAMADVRVCCWCCVDHAKGISRFFSSFECGSQLADGQWQVTVADELADVTCSYGFLLGQCVKQARLIPLASGPPLCEPEHRVCIDDADRSAVLAQGFDCKVPGDGAFPTTSLSTCYCYDLQNHLPQ